MKIIWSIWYHRDWERMSNNVLLLPLINSKDFHCLIIRKFSIKCQPEKPKPKLEIRPNAFRRSTIPRKPFIIIIIIILFRFLLAILIVKNTNRRFPNCVKDVFYHQVPLTNTILDNKGSKYNITPQAVTPSNPINWWIKELLLGHYLL